MQEKERMLPMVEVLETVKKEGYTTDFMVTTDGILTATTNNETFLPDQVKIVNFYRFEHDTNPDDMAILYVLETSSGLKGTMSGSYGTYSDTITENFMRQVEDIGKNLDKNV